MGTVPGRVTASCALAAAVIGAAMVTACGSQHAGSSGGGTGSSGGGTGSSSGGQPAAGQCTATPAPAGHTVGLSNKDNGKVLCIRQGTVLAIYLQGTPARKWLPLRAASTALEPVASGRLMLKLGVTGAFFKAVHPGRTAVVSSLPSCANPDTASSGPHCRMGTVFHVSFVISQ